MTTNPQPLGSLSPSVLVPNITPTAISAASASAGAPGANVYSLLNYLGVSGVGVDLTPGHTIVVLFEVRSAPATDYTFLSYCDATHGWLIDFNAGGDIRFLLKGAGVPALPTCGTVYPGLHCLAVTNNGGAMRADLDGRGIISLHANPTTYVSGIGTTEHLIGRVSATVNASGLPASIVGVLEYAAFSSAFTDAELLTAAGCIANLNRYQLDPATIGHAGLLYQWKVDRDYDPTAATTTAGAGSSPVTWTRFGNVSKNTIEQEYKYPRAFHNLWDAYIQHAQFTQDGVTPYVLVEGFARTIFHSLCTKLVIDVINDTVTVNNLDNIGILVNGSPPTGVSANGAEVLTQQKPTTCDAYALPGAAGQIITVLEGIQSSLTPGGTRRGIVVTGLRVPISTPITDFIGPKLTAKRVVAVGDSITAGQSVTTAPNLSPAYQGWTMLMRKNGASVFALIQNAYGDAAYHDDANAAGPIAAKVAQILSECDGLTDNLIIIALGTNDYGLDEWSAASFQTGLANYVDSIHTNILTVVPGAKFMVITPLTRLNEGAANGSGSTLPDYRTAINTVASTRAWMIVADGTTFVTYPGNIDAGGLHPTTAGQTQFEASARAFINANFPAFVY